jgi:tyrosinase
MPGNLQHSFPESDNPDLPVGNTNDVSVAIAHHTNQPCGTAPTAGGTQAPTQAQGITPVTQAVSESSVHIHPSSQLGGGSPQAAQKPEDGKEAQSVLHWTARISFKKYELGERHYVVIFLGELPEDPSQWRTCRSVVGFHFTYVSDDEFKNSRTRATMMGSDVPLNRAIAERSGLSSFEPSVVVPYLKDNLHWRIQAVCVFPLCLVSGLSIL